MANKPKEDPARPGQQAAQTPDDQELSTASTASTASTPAASPAAPSNVVTIESLQAQLAAANQRIAGFEAQAAQRNADEILISEKMGKGLTRQQAIASIERQRAFDKANPNKTVAFHAPDKEGKSAFTQAKALATQPNQ